MTVSAERREQARKALRRWQRVTRPTLPKCGAKRKKDGNPCEQVAMENGRCAWHGGRTPSGDRWHKVRWPNAAGAEAEQKLNRKLRDHQRAAKRRALRLEQMTPEERATHLQWQKTHQPGSQKARTAERIRRKQAADARALIESLALDEEQWQPPRSIDIFE
jgi:hypothetical protein